jgi:hypothetical protein
LRHSGEEVIRAKRVIRQYVLGHVAYGDPGLDYAVYILNDLAAMKNRGRNAAGKVEYLEEDIEKIKA